MTIVDAPNDPASVLEDAFGLLPTAIAAMCAESADGPVGMAVSSLTAMSLEPPLLSVRVMNTEASWRALRRQPRLGLSVFSDTSVTPGRRPSIMTGDLFTETAWRAIDDGAVIVLGSAAWFECSIFAELPAGEDNTVALLEIHSLHMQRQTARASLDDLLTG